MTEQLVCCVCNTPVTEGAGRLGQRLYCDRHYAHVTRDRRGLWLSTLIGIGALLLFVLLVSLLVRSIGLQLEGSALQIAGILLALIPAAIWLGVFYGLDRLEPEPKQYILGIFILGMLLAEGASRPLLQGLFVVQEWITLNGTLVNLIGSILVVGIIQEYLKYAGVRFSVYNSLEFDERVDGIIYGMTIGLGFATMLNLHYVLDSGGVRLDVGIMRIAIATLAQASFSGVTGYFLGRAKFEEMGPLWLPSGVLLAAVLNGVVNLVLREVTTPGLAFTPVYSLFVAAGVAAATFAVLFIMIRRLNAQTLAQSAHGPVQETA
jgi:RsiW-degrading membrane proteinase PrsW (M82 family)